MSKTVAGFNESIAKSLARSIDKDAKAVARTKSLSQYFHYFDAGEGLIVVVEPTEPLTAAEPDLALAHGLRHADGGPLTLILPKGTSEATRTRLPWLTASVTVLEHVDSGAHSVPSYSRAQVIAKFAKDPLRHGKYDLGTKTADDVRTLIEWASKQGLDHAPRPGYLSWHFKGRQVLQVSGLKGKSVTVAAGIQYTKPKPEQRKGFSRRFALPLSTADLAEIKRAVADGISDRILELDPPSKEHWFQGVLGGSPELIGLSREHLQREFPVFRPGAEKAGTGFIDLLGVDLLGRVQIVETKLGSDAMLALQGLDYWIWVQAHADAVRQEVLMVTPNAPVELHFVVDVRKGKPHLSPYTPSHLRVLAPDIPWHITGIENWETTPSPISLPIGELPK